MKYLILIIAFFLFYGKAYAYTHEEVLATLQKEVELNDPDSLIYGGDKYREEVADFMKKNQPLFDSLGKDETRYYIELAELNKNPNVTSSVILHAIHAYKKHYVEYTLSELEYIKQKFSVLASNPDNRQLQAKLESAINFR